MQTYSEILHAIAEGKKIEVVTGTRRGLPIYNDIGHFEVLRCISYKAISAHHLRVKKTTININGFEVPEPVRQELEPGQTYYYISFEFAYGKAYSKDTWAGFAEDRQRLLAGTIHLTEEAASLHAEALLSFTQKLKP